MNTPLKNFNTEDILKMMEDIPPQQAPDYLYSRITARMDARRERPVLKPVFIYAFAACIAVLMCFNIYIFRNTYMQKTEATVTEKATVENDYNYTTNTYNY